MICRHALRPALALAMLFAVLVAADVSPARAVEITLQNDSFMTGQPVSFQAGFVIGERAASRFVPPNPSTWQVKKIQLLFGGNTNIEAVTLRIWDDTAGTPTPGAEVFFGDYQLTGSNTLMQEIDLTANNVQVTGQFRVGIEYQHDGLPATATDTDGNIQASRNFVYVPPSWFEASILGLTGDWVLRAVVEEVVGPQPGAATILTIDDVGNDQGKQVRVRFARSNQDAPAATTPILHYEVLRRVDPLPYPMFAVQLDGWDYVAQVPAHGDAIYSVVVPTLADSSISQGLQWSAFMIRAATSAPLVFYDSAADSGYSVDNLPPVPPQAFAAAYSNGATHLVWDPNQEPDLWYYRLHRGGAENFVPDQGNLIATSATTGHDDPGPAGSYYKVAAVDVNGNVSDFALVTPEGTVGVDPAAAPRLALALIGPNPTRGGALQMSIELPDALPARIELLDLSGRRMASRSLEGFGPGRHTVDLSPRAALRSGVYLIRLTRLDASRSMRVVVTR